MEMENGPPGTKLHFAHSGVFLSHNVTVMAHICGLLEKAEITACELLFQGSNYVFLVALEMKNKIMRAIYKPCRGEVPLWDFPDGTLYKRECATYLVSQTLEWFLVPPTVIRNGPYGVGSVQWFVNIKHRTDYESQREKFLSQLKQVAIFDYLVNNADRKAGHCLEGYDGRLWMVDHGLTFNTMPKLRTVIWDFMGQPVSKEMVSDVVALQKKLTRDKSLRNTILRLIAPSELEALEFRIQRIINFPVFPYPESHRSVPWPWI
ncbi:SCO1664 family protein [Chloroflexota bacterium]